MHSDIHKLIFHLAKLMLDQEKHILPVDELFDDDLISDFVKSIQIDSPYQQLLLEGVLTESVKEENLYVGFTVEGYFHYVLGEVIYFQTGGKEANELKKLVEENTLKGAKEGVEQCLIRDLQSNDLSRLMWLIDEGGKVLDICIVPLASAFCNVNLSNKDDNEMANIIEKRVSYIFSILLVNSTDNDFVVLEKTINILKSTQRHNLVSKIYAKINETVIPDTLKKAKLYIDSIEFIPDFERKEKLNQIDSFFYQNKEKESFEIYNGIADQFKYISEFEKAQEFYEKALKIGIKEFSEESIEISGLYNDLGGLLRERADYEKAFNYIEKSILIDIKLYGENDPSLWAALGNLAAIYWLNGDYENALSKYEIAIEFTKIKFGKIHPNLASLYNNHGNVFHALGEYDKAINYFESALSISLKVYYENHDLTSSLYNNLGLVWRDKEDYEKALFFFEKSLSIYLNTYGEFHDSTALILANLGYLYMVKDDLDKALELCERSFHTCKKIHGLFHPTIGNVLNTLGIIWKEKGEKDNAIECFQQSLNNDIQLYGDSHYNVGISYFNIADYYMRINMLDDALNYYTQSLDIFLDKLGSDHKYTELAQKKINDLKDL
jgi:tetratricopeptide (TPR) repeat protein